MYSLIIVDYNSIKNTIDYILSCKEKLGAMGSSHIVIVQNGSFEGTLEELQSSFGEYSICNIDGIEQETYKFCNDFQEIYYCCSGDNLGYARGNNLAIQIAAKIWNDAYYIVSNNDLVFAEPIDLLLVSKTFEQNPTVGVIGPLIITPQSEEQSPRRWQRASKRLIINHWLTLFCGLFGSKCQKAFIDRHVDDTVKQAKTGLCAWVSGCFMFIRASAFKEAGMFDENTFLYAEEMILSKRMEKKGYGIFFIREIKIIHNHAQTTKKAISQLKTAEIDFNSNHYFYKHYTNTPRIVLFLATISFNIIRYSIRLKRRIIKK